MQKNPMVWVGLIQAYLLMTIIAILLVIGSGQANTWKWHVVGAIAHCPPLIAAFSSLDVFASMGVGGIVWVPNSAANVSRLKKTMWKVIR